MKKILAFILVLVSLVSLGQQNKTKLNFIENKGQWNPLVQYKLNIKGGNVYFHNNSLTYSFFNLTDLNEYSSHDHSKDKHEEEEDDIINCYAYRVNFLNSNSTSYQGIGKQNYFNNYFLGNDKTKWASSVTLFNGLLGKDLYSNIDVKFYSNNENLKYDFFIHPKGNVSDIKLEFEGAEEVKINDGNLIIKTSFDKVIEQKPYVYQIIDGKKIEIEAQYNLTNNIITYKVGDYNKFYDLIIDPVVVASTYSGSTEVIYGHTATYDDLGNIYSGGAGFSPGGLPVTVGAYQTSYRGSREMCILKYNAIGSELIFATYIGGSGNDYPHSLMDYNGSLYILGSSESNNYPTTSNAYDRTYNGGDADIVVTILNAAGNALLGSTYIGGSGTDGQNKITQNYGDEYRGEIVVDNIGNCYIASMSKSNNFPTTPGAYQSTIGGRQDGIAIKLNNNLSTLYYGTYLGGRFDDAAYGIIVDGNKTYVTGTAGNNFFNATGGAYPSNSGGKDGFVIALNDDATGIVHATYFGSNQDDQSFFIEKSLSGDIYILGQTEGSISTTGGSYYGGSGLFITKFNNSLSNRMFTSTSKNMAPVAFLVDDCDFIYASGHGGVSSLSGFQVTSNAVQQSSAGFYLMVLNPGGTSLNYGTYYGSNSSHVDGGTSRFDKKGIIYQATCTNRNFPTLPGSYSGNNSGGDYDVTVFKIDFELTEIKANAIPFPSSVGCAPFNVSFNNTSGGNKYFWNFGDGSPETNVVAPSHTFVSPGVYDVQLIAIDTSSSCILPDTLIIQIEVLGTDDIVVSNDTSVCPGFSAQLFASGGNSYVWSPSIGLNNTTISNPIATPSVTTTYQVISASTCNTDTGYVTITVFDINTSINNDTLICVEEEVFLQATGGISYSWSPSTGLSNDNISNPIAKPLLTSTYDVLITTVDGCSNTESITINVQQGVPVPVINNNEVICANQNVLLTISGGTSYFWYSNDGLINSTSSSISVNPSITTTYYVDLTNVCGTVTDSVIVTIQKPIAISSPGDSVCFNDTIQLWASGGVSYQWLPTNKVFLPNNNITKALPLTPTDFKVIVTDNIGCKDTAYTKIDFFPIPSIDAGSDVIVTYGEGTNLVPVNTPGNVYWNYHTTLNCTNCTNNFASPENTTTYIVNLTDKYGCKIFDDVTVSVDGVIYIPNSFTPNGDGINDVFYVKGEDITEYQLYIFNRWGDLIFESTDMNEGWDGTFKGTLSKIDTYVWKLKYSDVNTFNEQKHGHVNLLR